METRIWSRDRSLNKTIRPEQVRIGQPLKIDRPPGFLNGFRLSNYWSMHLSLGHVFEVGVAEEAWVSAFKADNDPRWKINPAATFRIVREITPLRLVGNLDVDNAEELFNKTHELHRALWDDETFIRKDYAGLRDFDIHCSAVSFRNAKRLRDEGIKRLKDMKETSKWCGFKSNFVPMMFQFMQAVQRIEEPNSMRGLKFMTPRWLRYRELVNALALECITQE